MERLAIGAVVLAVCAGVLLSLPASSAAITAGGAAGGAAKVVSMPYGAKSTVILPCTCPTQVGRVFIGRFTGPSAGVYVISSTAVIQKPYRNMMWLLPAVWHLGKATPALPTDCMDYNGYACNPHYLLADPSGLSYPKKIQFSGTGLPGFK